MPVRGNPGRDDGLAAAIEAQRIRDEARDWTPVPPEDAATVTRIVGPPVRDLIEKHKQQSALPASGQQGAQATPP